MIRIFGRNQVADYDAWRTAYDTFDKRSRGVRREEVHRNVSDPNEVTVMFDFDDQEAARAFLGSDEVRTAMREAGVAFPPTFWITSAA